MSTAKQRIDRGDDLYRLLSRLPGSEFGAAPECAETDPEAFMPGQGPDVGVIRRAKRICGRCPIRQSCLEFALRTGEPGIWGGTTAIERKRLRAGGGVVELGEVA
ncbi:WhiB family transcriptional regulator [Saccharopolyspora sp. 6M]|uniref:WhiB family transcriptional regulator n=1 Tax=Saccharopolyspora sp. 6M TaxID=2877237 RepID=UPI001CD26DB1|nr:WhiB family transcriptional regulator [Saccharopolyspora sp. 6M]MCA1228645.1 WhiB family transcriptional regulator [Saccharopolyspora sp. 6M]